MFIHTKVDILVLRLNKLKHLPPAWYATKSLFERGYDILTVEFSLEKFKDSHYPFTSIGIFLKKKSFIPRTFLFPALWFKTFASLFASFVKNGKPSFIFAHGLPEYSMGYFLSLLFRVPLVCHVHEVYEKSELSFLNRIFWRLGFLAMNHSEFVIFPEANRMKLYQQEHRIRAEAFTVFNAVKKAECPSLPELSIRYKLKIPDNHFLYLYLGGIGPENALEEAILALVELPTVSLVVGGWGAPSYVQSLKDLAGKCGVQNRVYFVGPVKDKWNYFFDADLTHCVYKPELLRLKYAGTASNKLMESIACGVPVLTTRNEDFKALIDKYDFGLCLPQVSSNEISRAIKALIADKAFYEKKSQNALKAYDKDLNYEVQMQDVLRKFQELLPIEPAQSEMAA